MWKLEQGISIVRSIQQMCRTYNYHVAIGGGVVNKGESMKDLDLYFLPMGGFGNSKQDPNPDGLEKFLISIWGIPEQLESYSYGKDISKLYDKALKFNAYGRRIDAFIIKQSEVSTKSKLKQLLTFWRNKK